MATYLVTGAAGFIAAKVCEQLLSAGHAVVGVDNLNDYYDVRLKDYRLCKLLNQNYSVHDVRPKVSTFTGYGLDTRDVPYVSGQVGVSRPRFEFHHLDIENLVALEEIFKTHKFDAVFNLAARAGVRYSIEFPHVYLSTNIAGTLNVLECQRKYSVKKQILASSSSLYTGSPMPFAEDRPVNTPQSPYAASKKAAEMIAYSYHQLYGLDISVLRYFTVFGPAGRPDMAPFRFVKWITEGTPITLYGDGSQARDFTYVDDIARGTILAAKPLGYEIINLGGGRNPISITAVIGLIEQTLQARAKIDYQPASAADMHETWADISKAKRLLGWEPAVVAEEGFKRTVAWHMTNHELVKHLDV